MAFCLPFLIKLLPAIAVCLQKVQLTGWMLVMSKLAEVQMESALTAAGELEEK